MNRFSVIHLSDLHFNNSSDFSSLWKKLIKDIEYISTNSGIEKYDFLFITGDFIDRGKIDLYDDIAKNIRHLKTEFKINKNHVFTVPGNHDINTSNESLKSVLEKENRETVINNEWFLYFQEYNDFSNKVGKNKKSYYVNTLDINGIKLRIIGFNTAWSSMLGKGFGELSIGETQFKTLESELDKGNSKHEEYDYTIALMHHPLDWFKYEERERVLKLFKKYGVNALLHGHIHESFAEEITDVDSTLTVLCTGWSYRKGETKKLTKESMLRYAIYDFDFNTHTINIYCRVTNKEQKKFIGDTFLYSCADANGFFSLPLGNPHESVYPVFAAPDTTGKRIDKPYFFLNSRFFDSFIETERNVSCLTQQMELTIDSFCNQQKIEEWLNTRENPTVSDYEEDSLGTLCYTLLLEVPSLFRFDTNNSRMMFRQYDSASNSHRFFGAYGKDDNPNNHQVKDFKWTEGMIYKASEQKRPLLKSANRDFHKDGNTRNKWSDYLTMTIDSVTTEGIPIYSLNIAITTPELYDSLLTLSLSSFHYSLNQMFASCQSRVRNSYLNYIDTRKGKQNEKKNSHNRN